MFLRAVQANQPYSILAISVILTHGFAGVKIDHYFRTEDCVAYRTLDGPLVLFADKTEPLQGRQLHRSLSTVIIANEFCYRSRFRH